jgi:RNA polymerase sigma factor (sigma-70 family)
VEFRRSEPKLLPLAGESWAAPLSLEHRPDESVLVAETAALIALAVARLPAQQRMVVVLRVWNEMPYSQIAEVVHCTEATVRSHMHHALTALRKYLEPRLRDD